MAQTTTAINACDAGVWLDTAAGTLTDIGGSSNEVSMDLKINIGEKRTFGSRWPIRLMCGKDASCKLIVVYSTATDEGADVIKDWFFQAEPGARTMKIYLPDKNVGSDVYSGEWVLETASWTGTSGEGEPMTIEATLLPSGAITLSQAAT